MARSLRRRGLLGLLFLLAVPIAANAQSENGSTEVPRTPWGDPDLQGIWLYWTATPLERPEEFADRAVVTAEEAAAFVSRQQDGVVGETSGDWNPLTGLLDGRTSLLTNPANGRLPERSESGQHRADTMGRPDVFVSADGPEDRERWERCIMGRSVPFYPYPFDQRIRIVQAQDYLAIQDEEGELRLIPVTERPVLSPSIRQWAGSSRGHWEGDTLVVETTNFNGKWSLEGTGPNMRLVERFTRTDVGILDYEFTVHDPESFAGSWSVAFPFTREPGVVYEYACHEGNYSMSLILSGARAQERAEQTK